MTQRVLLIDDSPQMHRLVEGWLRSDQIELISAASGAEGLEIAVSRPVDMILLDVDMPDVSGFDLCRKLKSESACASVPIVFLTGAGSPDERVAGLNLGATDYIIKPFHPAEFQARVRAALRTKQLLDLLQQRAQIDGLTSLRNRAYLDQRLAAEMAGLARRPGHLACVMIDVDDFKKINDRYGHLAGDEVLRVVASSLQSGTRAEDVVARYGGEEFVLLLPDIEESGAAVLAERLRETIASQEIRRLGGSVSIRITCSFGIAVYDPEAPAELLSRADAALYAAKKTGKNQVQAYRRSMRECTAA